LIWGREDQTFPFELSEKTLRLMPQMELHTIDEVGH
jgi:pimeloyl-ACP methyl ester carboxylesterase